MVKKSILIFISILVHVMIFGQELPKFHLTLEHGAQQYSGEAGNGFYNFKQAYYDFLGFNISGTIEHHWDVFFGWTKGDVGYQKPDYTSFLLEFTQIHFGVRGYLFKQGKRIRPYGQIAFGHNTYRTNRIESIQTNSLPSLGFGLNLNVTEYLTLQVGERFLFTNYDKMDGQHGGRNDRLLQHHVGVTMSFGKPRDDDGDGINNKNDKCPKIAGLPQFMGCLDTDEDGIPDYEDDCPQLKGIAKLFGCPDFDGDGVSDIEDACPQEKGDIKYAGCPDEDYDGIPNNKDHCPEIAGLIEHQGCPDKDEDGIPDYLDDCPAIRGLAKYNGCNDLDNDGVPDQIDVCPELGGLKTMDGCPDSDGDGISDKYDACPKKAGTKSKKGCPEIKPEELDILIQALKGIQFNLNESKLLPSSYDILDQVANIMKRNSHYKLRIEGHTNAVGDDQFNLMLSSNRAEAVKSYLIRKGVKTDRMKDLGFGNAKPQYFVGENKDSARNDRVELIIEF